jgi:hypothetical protein
MESNEPIQGNAPTRPSMNARSLVLWIGDHTSAILNEPGQDVVGTVAMRLANASRNAGALRKARRAHGIGVAFDTEAWRNQCRPDHVYRRESFQTLGYDSRDLFNTERVDIETALTDSRVAAYSDAQLKAQIPFDPTIFQTPAHISPTVVAMENDIRLAEATIELVNRRALREPADGDKHERPRALFATICVTSSALSRERISEIAHRYALLDVDGYWIWAVDFEAYGVRAERMLRLVLALQEASGRPVCPGGLGNLWQAALARGAAGAINGPDRGSLEFDPEQAPPEPRDPDDEDDKDGRRIHTYHGAILGMFRFGKDGDKVLARTFARNACGCGHHAAGVPPQGRRETVAHNQWWRLKEARHVCRGTAEQASSALQERLPVVQAEREAVGLSTGLKPGWQRSVEEWDQLPVGWGAAEGRAA